MDKQIKHPIIYETDDVEQAKAVASNYNGVSVVYHNSSEEIPPILTSIINGKIYTKYNPEYVRYLKSKFPGISDEEISINIEQKVLDNQKVKAKRL